MTKPPAASPFVFFIVDPCVSVGMYVSYKTYHTSVNIKVRKQMNKIILKFILLHGSYKKAAKALGVSESSVGCWARGSRNISFINAARIVEMSDGAITYDDLLAEIKRGEVK